MRQAPTQPFKKAVRHLIPDTNSMLQQRRQEAADVEKMLLSMNSYVQVNPQDEKNCDEVAKSA